MNLSCSEGMWSMWLCFGVSFRHILWSLGPWVHLNRSLRIIGTNDTLHNLNTLDVLSTKCSCAVWKGLQQFWNSCCRLKVHCRSLVSLSRLSSLAVLYLEFQVWRQSHWCLWAAVPESNHFVEIHQDAGQPLFHLLLPDVQMLVLLMVNIDICAR